MDQESHLTTDAASTVGAVGDDRTTADHEDSLAHRPRQHDDDDDDEGSDDGDDDVESTTSVQAAENPKSPGDVEDVKELPPHACA